jgi:hypothetical protein
MPADLIPVLPAVQQFLDHEQRLLINGGRGTKFGVFGMWIDMRTHVLIMDVNRVVTISHKICMILRDFMWVQR